MLLSAALICGEAERPHGCGAERLLRAREASLVNVDIACVISTFPSHIGSFGRWP